MKNLLIAILVLGFVGLTYSQASQEETQTVVLDGVTLSTVNMGYLSVVRGGTESMVVLNLQREAASYDITKSSIYNGEDKFYQFKFNKGSGSILATYNKGGKIIRSHERFKDIIFPSAVQKSIYKTYPGWLVEGNTYIVSYQLGKDAKKVFKVKLAQGSQNKSLKIGPNGNWL